VLTQRACRAERLQPHRTVLAAGSSSDPEPAHTATTVDEGHEPSLLRKGRAPTFAVWGLAAEVPPRSSAQLNLQAFVGEQNLAVEPGGGDSGAMRTIVPWPEVGEQQAAHAGRRSRLPGLARRKIQ